jgi:uncharacterized protein (DUF488 family)
MRHGAGDGNAGRAWLLRHNPTGYGNRSRTDVAFKERHGEQPDRDMARKAKRLFTIGYEQTPPKAVLDELENAGVKLLVDVRAVAASRRPGFSKNQLAAGLDERGISYLHLRALGTPKDGRDAARSGKFDTLHKIYAAHLKTPQAREQLDELSSLVKKSGPVCILCYERDHRHCHRQWIAEIIEARDGVKVENLVAPQV